MLAHIAEYLYIFLTAWLALYGFNALYLTLRYWAVRNQRTPSAPPPDEWPKVTVQLPIYNERHVVARLLKSVSQLDYPRDKLEIQILDDSTDDTRELAEALANRMRRSGVNMRYLHRSNRIGYKAGALAHGLSLTDSEFVAVFDADFVPAADFLIRTIPHFRDPRIGCVQTRWGYLNPGASSFTRALSVAMDGHYLVEKVAQNRSGYLVNFNGSAGVWRRSAIESCGGWQADTLTEDLDLSLRAQTAGWKFLYLPDVVSPAELPFQVEAFRRQQARWAKGSVQTMRKAMGGLWRSKLPFFTKFEASILLSSYLVQPTMLLTAGLTAILSLSDSQLPRLLTVLSIAALGVPLMLITAQLGNGRPWRYKVLDAAQCMLIGFGITATCTRSVLEAFAGIETPFLRTPKFASGDQWMKSDYSLRVDPAVWAESATMVIYLCTVAATFSRAFWGALPIVLLPVLGQFYVLGYSFRQTRHLRLTEKQHDKLPHKPRVIPKTQRSLLRGPNNHHGNKTLESKSDEPEVEHRDVLSVEAPFERD